MSKKYKITQGQISKIINNQLFREGVPSRIKKVAKPVKKIARPIEALVIVPEKPQKPSIFKRTDSGFQLNW